MTITADEESVIAWLVIPQHRCILLYSHNNMKSLMQKLRKWVNNK